MSTGERDPLEIQGRMAARWLAQRQAPGERLGYCAGLIEQRSSEPTGSMPASQVRGRRDARWLLR